MKSPAGDERLIAAVVFLLFELFLLCMNFPVFDAVGCKFGLFCNFVCIMGRE